MTELRRRTHHDTQPGHEAPAVEESSFAPVKPTPPLSLPTRRFLTILAIGGILAVAIGGAFLLVPTLTSRFGRPPPPPRPLLTPSTAPDDEATLSASLLPVEDVVSPDFHEKLTACMPTVSRRGVEYVSNAVKSWRLATNGSTSTRRLLVFDMDEEGAARPGWLRDVFAPHEGPLPSWLQVFRREERPPMAPRKLTLGDSQARAEWRSKEALDYVEVLRRCAEETDAAYLLVVQDDVLFTRRMMQVYDWCEEKLVDLAVDRDGRRIMQRICGASLFDVPGSAAVEDGHLLASSNMVARVWDVDRLAPLYRYILVNYDEAPVDWLADRICKSQRRRTLVMEPNPVRHRGKVSSFVENKRDGLLT